MTDLALLTKYMKPFYQEAGDQALLQTYLDTYTTPACAAYHLWMELAGEKTTERSVERFTNGAESTKYVSLTTQYNVFMKNADYYKGLCEQAKGTSVSLGLTVKKADVAGVPSSYGSDYGPDYRKI